ncbi:hypothetical protein LDENG_00134280 [Lucifuga dentata]|nr:hypothetical protein LDENG_00134280 [Lucifuga dentata]
MDRSDVEDDIEEGEMKNEEGNEKREKREEDSPYNPNPLSQLDFYQADPFTSCQSEHDLFNEDLFPKTDSSDGFAADPFKGNDPFAADVLFPEVNLSTDVGEASMADEGDASLSCADNKASTGTQCFESEFPDEDSDIEISYSREDLDILATTDAAVSEDARGFKPIQSSSEELGPELSRGWRSQGQYSVESDPNGYELDLGAVSPPIQEHSLASLPGEATAVLKQDLGSAPVHAVSDFDARSEPVFPNPDWTDHGTTEQILPCQVTSCHGAEWDSNVEGEPRNPATPHNSVDSQDHFVQVDSKQNKDLSFELSYEPSQSSFDPYGFKLSPEHSNHSLLDPDEAELSPEPNDPDLAFEHEPLSSQPEQLNFDPYEFDISSSHIVRDSDPYGFKLSPEEENQEVLDLCDHDNQDEMDVCRYDNKEEVSADHNNQVVLEHCPHENQEVLELCSHNTQDVLDLWNNGNQEVLQPSSHDSRGVLELAGNENQELLELSNCKNKEVLEPFCYSQQEQLEPCKFGNQEVLEPCSHQELEDGSCHENQEVLDVDSHVNQEILDLGSDENQEVLVIGNYGNQEVLGRDENQEVLDLGSCGNQEVLDLLIKEILPEANNNNCSILENEIKNIPTSNSSDSDQASEVSNCPPSADLQGLELSNTSICTTNTTNNPSIADPLSMATSNAPTSHNFLEGDLSSVFGAGGYISCPDVADDLEPLESRKVNPVAEPARPVRPVRPPRPSLRAKEKAQSQTQDIDLK